MREKCAQSRDSAWLEVGVGGRGWWGDTEGRGVGEPRKGIQKVFMCVCVYICLLIFG